MKWPTKAEMLFSAKSFVAAMLALYLAMWIGLPRPFWAPLAAYVVSQPFSGAVRSKAIYRFLGTLLGAAMAVILVSRLINYSVLLTLALSLWLGGCLYISLLDRTPRSYTFMLAGYTPVLIGLPSLIDVSAFNAVTMFDTALARVEEITIGVACASLIHGLVFPQSIGPVILRRMDQALDDALVWMRHALLGDDKSLSAVNHRKLMQDITELRLMSTHLPFDTSNLKWTANAIRVLQDRLSSLVPFMTAVEDRINILRSTCGDRLPPYWQMLMEDVVEWTRQGTNSTPESAIQLRRRINDITPIVDGRSSWDKVLEVNLAAHMSRLIDACENCFHQRRQIAESMQGRIPVDPRQLSRVPTRALHTDQGMALMSGFAAAMALCISCAFWIISGWPLGFAAPMIAGMFCAFFSTLDNPVPALKVQLVYTIYSTPIAGIYLLWLLPSAHSFEMLMLVMAPFLLVGGIYLSRPSTMLMAVPLCFTPLANLMMFDMGSSDMTSFINSQISQAIGAGVAVLCTGLLRSVSAEWTARRLLRSGWEEIVRLAQSVKPPSLVAVTVRMVDRVSLLTPRLAVLGEGKVRAAANALEDLRVGMNLAYLLRVRSRLKRNNVSIEPLLRELAEHFQNMPANLAKKEPALLEKIDSTLHNICSTLPFPMRNEAVAALAGVRRDLFPKAPPYRPETQTHKDIG
ncbi:MAG: FUSC family protein [Burkholderiaceae bacterium]|nr:FUSC family protein [Burkholderiaceae bacterium]